VAQQFSQSAVAVQGLDGGEDEDNEEEEDLGDDAVEAVEQEVAASKGLGLSDISIDVRWRACMGDMEKNPIAAAYNCERGGRLINLDDGLLWDWVGEVLEDLKPKKVTVSSLCAVVYPARQAKRDRSIKRLRCGDYLNWLSFVRLV
jgi:hypothetical protein